jgi:hypothetical protein
MSLRGAGATLVVAHELITPSFGQAQGLLYVTNCTALGQTQGLPLLAGGVGLGYVPNYFPC